MDGLRVIDIPGRGPTIMFPMKVVMAYWDSVYAAPTGGKGKPNPAAYSEDDEKRKKKMKAKKKIKGKKK